MLNSKFKIQNSTVTAGFTIVELLVAMTIMTILTALASVIFAAALKAFRIADATMEITRRADAICSQLTQDFTGLRKDGEIFLAWVVAPIGDPLNPTGYQKFDRIIFFADGNFQTYNAQASLSGDKQITGNLARVSYVPAKNKAGQKAQDQLEYKNRILARTQHIYTADTDINYPLSPYLFPVISPWVPTGPTGFETYNYSYEYQTMTMAEWTNLSSSLIPNEVTAKNNILTILSDIQSILAVDNTVTTGGPIVDKSDSSTYHNLFAEGVGEFAIQIWYEDPVNGPRWYPQLDLTPGDNDYTDGDYPLNGTLIDTGKSDGILYNGSTGKSFAATGPNTADWKDGLMTYTNIPLKFTALKFTFTLHDSKGQFPNGRTFTHIVMIDK